MALLCILTATISFTLRVFQPLAANFVDSSITQLYLQYASELLICKFNLMDAEYKDLLSHSSNLQQTL